MNYNRQYLNMVNLLGSLNAFMYCKRSGDRIVSQMRNKVGTIIYALDAPHSYFEFSGDEIAVNEFKSFHNMISFFKNDPEIHHDSSSFTIECEGAKFRYPEAMRQMVRGVCDNPLTFSWSYRVRLTRKFYEELRKKMNLAGAKNMRVTIDPNGVFSIYAERPSEGGVSSVSTTAYSQSWSMDQARGIGFVEGAIPTPIDLKFTTDAFNMLPWLEDSVLGYEFAYDMMFDPDGIAGFVLTQVKTELPEGVEAGTPLDIALTIYASVMNEEDD